MDDKERQMLSRSVSAGRSGDYRRGGTTVWAFTSSDYIRQCLLKTTTRLARERAECL